MRRRGWETLLRFWATDHGLSVFLGVLVVLVFVVSPIATPDLPGRLALDAFFSLLLVAGVVVTSESRRIMYLVLPVAAAALAIRWVSWLAPSAYLTEMGVLSRLVFYGLFCLVILVRVFSQGQVTLHRVQGAIAGYLLLGLAWASAYQFLAMRNPGAFTGSTVVENPHHWVYYSFVTLTTMGYGDVVPIHPVARSLAILEALTGQLYPAILLARLVSLEVQSR